MKGILIKPEMIVATVEGRKTNTRRAEAGLKEINKDPDAWKCQMLPSGILACRKKILYEGGFYFSDWVHIKPRYQVGETVYIKEAIYLNYDSGGAIYRDSSTVFSFNTQTALKWRWHSDILEARCIPAEAARHFILILGNSAELLGLPLSSEEMELEGGEATLPMLEKINGLWVFRYEFEYLRQERR